jgi:hypothetical protein
MPSVSQWLKGGIARLETARKIGRLAEALKAQRVHMIAIGWESRIPQILDDAGIGDG